MGERPIQHADDVRGRLAAVVESSDDAIISKTLEGIIVTWNQAAQRIFGYTVEEIVGRSVTVLIPPELVDDEPRILERVKRGERIDHYETTRLRKDGTRIHVSLTVSPIRDGRGQIIGASKIARDVTRQREAQQLLAQERRTLELLQSTGTAIAGQLDLQTLVQTVTDAAIQLSGARFGAFFYNMINDQGEAYVLYTLSGAPRESFEKFGLPRNTGVFEPTFRGRGPVRSGDITQDPRYGKMAPHYGMPKGHLPVRSYLAVPVISRSGEVIGGLFFGHPETDVFTERVERVITGVAAQAAVAIDNARLFESAQREIASRERAEALLRDTDRRKDEFLATLAHELRNPLAPIRQAAMIARSATATESQKRWSNDVISRQVHTMALLLDDLLDISRITRGTLELRIEKTQLSRIIDAAVETARPAIDAKQHVLTLEVPKEPVEIFADPLRLAQVIANLLTNAAKYTDPEGNITLKATREGDGVVLRVRDSGIGIPPQMIPELFNMFAQVQSDRDRSEGGLGIGLALARGLIELHGGHIEARSAGLGEGAEFLVRLPLRATVPEPRFEEPTSEAGLTLSRRVLIADDNRDAAESLATLMRLDGHDVHVVHDGSAAVTAFIRFKPEFVFLDIGMPGLNGYEVARKVRKGSVGQPITLVAVTGWGQETDKARATAAGFDHHFTKPVDPQRLTSLIRETPPAA
ncbi:MAG TPA: PAS domain S-box protein [Steroidobacteraceae bacterium]|jgi:PAS domain S-box-containing protein